MTDKHPLQPLLNPRSVALVGASAREGSVGRWLFDTFTAGDFPGVLYLVNPGYTDIAGQRCYADLADLPEKPEMAILNVGSARMEALFDHALGLGIRAFTIFDYCMLEDDSDPKLLERLRTKAKAAGALICGGGGMGYYNLDARVHATYYNGASLRPGAISLIAHSGSVFTVLAMADPRCRFNLIVSAGSEIATTAGEFLSYAVSMPTTKVVALFLETVRDVPKFLEALEEAAERDVAVVVCKVGKSEKSKEFALTHTGAAVGNQAAYDAVFDRYGVLATDSLDEMMATAALMANGRRAGPGGIGAITDSGGLRQLFADLAADIGVRFAEFNDDTLERIQAVLPHTLEVGNPLDAAGVLSNDYEGIFAHCAAAIVDNPDTALGWFEFDATDEYQPFPGYLDIARSAAARTDKPFVVVNSASSTINTRVALELLDAGIPLINGARNAVIAARNLFKYRDFRARRETPAPQPVDPASMSDLVTELSARRLSEVETLKLLSDFGVPSIAAKHCSSYQQALTAAEALGFPIAMKTAVTGIDHKSDIGGVHLNIQDTNGLASAYEALAAIGSEVTVARMAPIGIELAFGMIRDPQFGPLVVVSAGGTLIEYFKDRAVMLAPVNPDEARRHIERLSIYPILQGVRGRSAVNMNAVVDAFVQFSVLAASVGADVKEMDVNPVMATEESAVAVDALLIANH